MQTACMGHLGRLSHSNSLTGNIKERCLPPDQVEEGLYEQSVLVGFAGAGA